MMKSFLTGLFGLIAATLIAPAFGEAQRVRMGALVIEDVPEIPREVVERINQYQNTRSAWAAGWLGDDLLITTRFGETNQLHVVQQPGGARTQITFFPEPVSSASPSPDPEADGFLFTMDEGGGEYYQIYWFDRNSGRHRMISDGESRNSAISWSPSGEYVAYTSTRRNNRDHDIYISHRDALHEARLVLQEGGLWSTMDWSPDESAIVVRRYISINESYLHLLDLDTGVLTQINPSEERISYGSALFSKRCDSVYYTSDENSEFMRLRRHDLQTGAIQTLTGDIDWDIGGLTLSRDGRWLAFVVNEGGVSRLYLMDTDTGERVRIDELPEGIIGGLHFDALDRRLAIGVVSPRTPGDVFTLTLDDRSIQQWTFSEVGGLDVETLVAPTLIDYPTFDEVDGAPRRIPAFYYRPNEGLTPYPVLINIHGGPESQARPTFNPMNQYIVNELGVAVIFPNVRGSSGYGKTYLDLDNGFLREDAVLDIGALLDWVALQPELDESRVAVMGGSYGGYMSLACMTHFNDRLRAGVSVVGISNFVTFLENTADYRRDLRRVEYGDERDPDMREFLIRISPTTNAHKITKPMMIAQGLNDPRVPAGESEQIVEAVRENEGEVWYILAEDEGHGFSKKSNRDYYQQALAMFLQRFLVDEVE